MLVLTTMDIPGAEIIFTTNRLWINGAQVDPFCERPTGSFFLCDKAVMAAWSISLYYSYRAKGAIPL